MEPEVVAPVWVEIEHVVSIIASSAAVVAFGEDVLEPVLEFFGNVAEVHEFAGAGGTFDLEVLAVVHVVAEERLNQKEVDTKPNGLWKESFSILTH